MTQPNSPADKGVYLMPDADRQRESSPGVDIDIPKQSAL
jgi:hypothetical protein